MKVCLISPPYNSAVKSVVGASSPPLGLAYIASVLRQSHEVKIIDSNILNYTIGDVERELRSFNPDVVGITSVTPSIYEAYKVAETAKKVREDCTVVLGGPHATFMPRQTMEECKYIDIIIRSGFTASINSGAGGLPGPPGPIIGRFRNDSPYAIA